MKNLSEVLANNLGGFIGGETKDDCVDRARALEERVAELEQKAADDAAKTVFAIATARYERDAAIARVALEAENERLRAFNLPSDHAMRVARQMHAELKAENGALKARIAKAVKVAKKAQGNAIAYIDNLVPASDILSILVPEGEE